MQRYISVPILNESHSTFSLLPLLLLYILFLVISSLEWLSQVMLPLHMFLSGWRTMIQWYSVILMSFCKGYLSSCFLFHHKSCLVNFSSVRQFLSSCKSWEYKYSLIIWFTFLKKLGLLGGGVLWRTHTVFNRLLDLKRTHQVNVSRTLVIAFLGVFLKKKNNKQWGNPINRWCLKKHSLHEDKGLGVQRQAIMKAGQNLNICKRLGMEK